MRGSLAERFEAKYIPEPNSGCWLWTGALNSDGYGGIGESHTRRVLTAQRAAWQLYRGEIPNGMHVLHRCDVRCCVNPDHLFLGTHQENIADCKAKGRAVRAVGEKQHNAKLTADKVRRIRNDTRTLKAIAREYGVSFSTVSFVKRRETWKHVE